MSRSIVIVGAGQCGTRAAFTLRECGYDGAITLIGQEPHLPYERPPLSKPLAALAELGAPVQSAQRFAEVGIDLRRGATVDAIDRTGKRILVGGTSMGFDLLLLATGASPRRLMHHGTLVPHVHYLRSLEQARRIRTELRPGRRLVLVGGGFIGLEVAALAAQAGVEVTVVEALPQILRRGVPGQIAARIADRHRRAGVRILTGAGIGTIETRGDGTMIGLADGEVLEADLLVAGIGSMPETSLADAAGLATDNGIVIDAQFRTSDASIFAAGDCCSFLHPLYPGRRIRLESWRNALDQGAAAARAMLGIVESGIPVPRFWSDQYELTLQVAGLPDESQAVVRREIDADTLILFHLTATGRLAAAAGIGPGNAVARDIGIAERLIGLSARPDPALLSRTDVRLKSLLERVPLPAGT